MEKQEELLLILIVVLAIAISVGITYDLRREIKSVHILDEKVSAKQPSLIEEQSSGKSLFLTLEEKAKRITVERDPFTKIPIDAPEEAEPVLVLNGVLWDEESPSAMINEKIVAQGDTIHDHVVVEIKKDRVIVNNGMEDIELLIRE